MKLICERTTFIPGFCVFALHHNGFGASQPPGQSTTHRPRAVTRKGSVFIYLSIGTWVPCLSVEVVARVARLRPEPPGPYVHDPHRGRAADDPQVVSPLTVDANVRIYESWTL
jgi:hypothetical protein